LHQIKRLMNIKRNNYQNEEAAHRMGENICWLFICQEYTDTQTFKLQKNK
jgi:hypothetical protein